MLITLAQQYGIGAVLLIFIIGAACVLKIVGVCKDLWAKRSKFAEDNINKGKQIEANEEAAALQQLAQETQINDMQQNIALLTEIVENQKQQLELLIESDKLTTKAWIKQQHDIWMPKQCIDSQVLDLLEEKYAIYKKENGNSWAKRLMEDLRALPLITVIQLDSDGE